MRSISIFLVVFTFLASSATQAATYKWTDENGNVVYSQQPPKSGPYELIKGLKHSRSTSGENSGETQFGSDDNKEEGSGGLSAEEAKLKEQNCEAARRNLEVYKVYKRVKNQDGEITTLTDEERQKRVEEAESQVRLYCN